MSLKKDILNDVDDIAIWLEKRNVEISMGQTEVSEKDLPVLARVICGGESEVALLEEHEREKYRKHFKDNKKNIASLTLAAGGVTELSVASIASGASAVSAIATLGTCAGGAALGLSSIGVGLAGMGTIALVPALWPVGISMLMFGAGSIFAKSKAKKTNAPRSEKLEKTFNESSERAKECNEKIQENNKKIREILSQKISKAVESLSEFAKKISIRIDDALNTDQNLRIMQYQEIVLKQYNAQNEIRNALADLIDAYNKLVAENEELACKVAAYEATMKMCGCANNFLQ